jgi:hypothetical protein
VVHAWVLARSDRKQAWKFLMRALESDVADVQGDSQLGTLTRSSFSTVRTAMSVRSRL